MRNLGQWPAQARQITGTLNQQNLLGSMLNRPFEGASTLKMNNYDQSTKVNERGSEARGSEATSKHQPRNQGFFSAASNKIGASIMKSKKLDLSVALQESSDQSNKQLQERRSANQAKLVSTPKMKNINGFSLANHGGFAGLGLGNAPHSNIKSHLKVPIASYDNRKMLFGSGYGKDAYGSDAKEFMRSCDSKKSVPFGQRFLHFDQSSGRDETDVPQHSRAIPDSMPKSFADLCGNTTILGMPQGHDKHQLSISGKQSSLTGPLKPSSTLNKLHQHSNFHMAPQFYNNFYAPNAFIHHQHHNPAVPTGFASFMQPIQHSKTCTKAHKMSIIRPFEEQINKQESASSSDAVSSKYIDRRSAQDSSD